MVQCIVHAGTRRAVRRYHFPMIRSLPAVVLFAAAGLAHAQVYKCVDGSGRTTYQQEPCAKTEKGARVELQPDNGSSRDPATMEAQWASAAKQGQVVTGMPKRYVQAAYGTPTEVRGGSSTDRVSEVWIFRHPGGGRRVGFLDGRVAFDRGEDASAAPPSPEEIADTNARRDASPAVIARRTIAQGRDCAGVISEAGPPDRSEGVQAPKPGPGGAMTMTPGLRHIYDDDGGGPSRSMAFTCVNGVVTDVERPAR
jgi:hypothetical protein